MPRPDVRILDPKDYEVVWIAPLEIEARAALYLLDERHDGRFTVARGDDYVFHAGSMCDHNIVIATLPAGQEYGTGSAGALASQVKKFFPNLWFGLLVGVAAGLPNLSRRPPRDIRLGDVLVGLGEGESAGLIPYDLGKETSRGFEALRGGHVLAMTEAIVRSAIGKIKVEAPHDAQKFLHYYETIRDREHAQGTFADPGEDIDSLYVTREDGTAERVKRSQRPEKRRTRVWYGPIGSGEKLLKNEQKRDELRDRYGLIGLEMEAAGTMSRIPVGVIRGVCDYGDKYKNKEWQPYAAAMAAAYGKAVLAEIAPAHEPAAQKLMDRKSFASESSNGPFYYIQLPKNTRFTGRAAILRALEETLLLQQSCERLAIVGLGGVGKTQIALRFVYQVKESRPDYSIFWVPILSNSSLEQAYVEIANRIGLQRSSQDDIKKVVCQYLSSDQAGKWLMVVDNADDRDLLFGNSDSVGIEEYLPQSWQGSIILTTRSRQVAGEFAQTEIVDVEHMSYDEALPFFEKSLNKCPTLHDNKTVRELLTHLTYLPLAIAQAAAYLNQTKIPIHKYLSLLRGAERDVARVLGRDFRDNTRYRSSQNAIATTWLVSFEQIQGCDSAATHILSFLSCIEPKAIPQSILPNFDSEEELEWAIGTLCGYFFLVRRGDSDIFDMHHLVQLAIRGWIEKCGRQVMVRNDGINHLARIFPSSDFANRDVWRQYLPHALRLLAESSEHNTKDRADLNMSVGQCLDEDRRFKEAIDRLQAACQYREQHLPKHDYSRLLSEHELARAYLNDRRIKDAIKILERVVSIQNTALEKDNHFCLLSQHELARAYLDDRRIKEAIQIFEHVASVRNTTLDKANHFRLLSQHELARAYLDDRRIEEATEILEHTVSVQKATSAKESHSRLASEYQLARAYLSSRWIKKAIEMFEYVISVQETALTEKDHGLLLSKHQLGRAYLSDRRIREAIEIFEHIVWVQKTTLAEEDHDRLGSEHMLASAYLNNRRIREAIKIFEHVVSVRKTTLAVEDHSRLASEHELARAYLDDGRIQEAIVIFEHVVSVQRTTLTEKDHYRLASEHGLASAYLSDHRIEEAIEIFEHVVSIRRTTLAVEDHSRLASEHELARAYLNDRRIKEAISLLEHVVSVQKTTLAQEDHDRLTSEHGLGIAYLYDQRIQEAIKILEHTMMVQKTSLAKGDHCHLASEHALAIAYIDNDQSQKAIDVLQPLVAIEESLFRLDDPVRLISQELWAAARSQLEAEWERTGSDSVSAGN